MDFLQRNRTGGRILIPFTVATCGKMRGCDSTCHGGVKAERWPAWSKEYMFFICVREVSWEKKKIVALAEAG